MAESLFMAAQDDAYVELKDLYSFPVHLLLDQFRERAMSVCGELMSLAKQHNLMRFREICLQHSFGLPDTPFMYDSGSIDGNPALAGVEGRKRFELDDLVHWNPDRASPDLAADIQATYPNTPWIVAYFVTVTFPTTFGHFLSVDLAREGLSFIRSHIGQREIAGKLLGSFLLHSFVFRDRLLDNFCQRVTLADGSDRDRLRNVFLACYAASLRYLSRAHVDAIQLFAAEFGRTAAAETIIERFLTVVVQYWQAAPFLPGLTMRPRGRGARADFPLKDCLLDFARHPDAARHLIDPLADTCTSDPPNLAFLVPPPVFGFRFDVSHVDEVLMLRLDGRRFVAGQSDAAAEAFRLRMNRTYYFQYDRKWDERPVVDKDPEHLTKEELSQRRAFHHFCIRRSGAFRTIDLWLGALRRILTAQSRLVVSRRPPASAPGQFALEQFTRWGYDLFCRLGFEKGFVEYVRGLGGGGDVEAFVRAQIGQCLRANLRARQPVAEAVLGAAKDCISRWKVGFNRDPIVCTPVDLTLCGYFCDAVLRAADAMFACHLSAHPVPLLCRARSEVVAELREVLQKRERQCHFPVPLPREEDVAATLGPIRDFLTAANLIAQYSFESGRDVWGSGDQLMFFLWIEGLLNFYFTKRPHLADWPTTCPSLMISIFPNTDDPTGPIYIRGWLLKILHTVEKWKNGDPGLGEALGDVGHLILTDERLSALDRLAYFFLLEPFE
jgi:hypothetical protein